MIASDGVSKEEQIRMCREWIARLLDECSDYAEQSKRLRHEYQRQEHLLAMAQKNTEAALKQARTRLEELLKA